MCSSTETKQTSTVLDSGALAMIWTDKSKIINCQPTRQCLLLADGVTKVECDGYGHIETSGGIKLPVLYVENWPRNYVSVRVLNKLGYAVSFANGVSIVRMRDGKTLHYSPPSATGLFEIDLFE